MKQFKIIKITEDYIFGIEIKREEIMTFFANSLLHAVKLHSDSCRKWTQFDFTERKAEYTVLNTQHCKYFLQQEK